MAVDDISRRGYPRQNSSGADSVHTKIFKLRRQTIDDAGHGVLSCAPHATDPPGDHRRERLFTVTAGGRRARIANVAVARSVLSSDAPGCPHLNWAARQNLNNATTARHDASNTRPR